MPRRTSGSRTPRAGVRLPDVPTPGVAARRLARTLAPRLRPAQRVALGTLLVLTGLALLLVPLTTLTLAWAGTVVGLGVVGVRRLRSGRRGTGLVLLALALGTAAAAPIGGHVTHVLAGVWALACALRALSPAAAHGGPWIRLGAVVTGLSAALLAVRWPDLGTLALAWACALAVVVGAGATTLRAGRVAADAADAGVARAEAPAPVRRRELLSPVAAALALVVTGGAWWLDARLGPVAPEPTSFYAVPGTVPAGPGEVVRTEPYDGVLPSGVVGTRMLYTTTRADGSPAVASALVALPEGSGRRTLVAWQHGTLGNDVRCAPSLLDDALTDTVLPGARGLLGRGWGLVALDYPGLGVDGAVPYLVGEDEGRAALDAVRAAQRLDAGREAGPVLLWGHSQGGHATLWAGQLAASYAPDVDVRGVAALSAANDPAALAAHTTRDGVTGFAALAVAFVVDAYADAYDDVARDGLVDPAGRAFLDAAVSRCTADPGSLVTVLATAATSLDRQLFSVDDPAVARRLEENAASGDVGVPLLLAQGDADTVVPVAMQRALAERTCRTGAAVTVREHAGLGHLDVVAPGSPLVGELLAWSDDVLAGGTPRSCG